MRTKGQKYINEYSLQEKIQNLVKYYIFTKTDLTLAVYIAEEEVRFFWFENMMPGKKSTCTLDWISGGSQKTYNIMNLSEISSIYESEKIIFKNNMISEKYPDAKQNLRGRYVNKEGEIVEIEINEKEIEEKALEKTVNEVIERTWEAMNN